MYLSIHPSVIHVSIYLSINHVSIYSSLIYLLLGCTFTTNSMRSYRQHLRLEHTNESIFCCHVCNKKYPLGSKLTEHLKKIHGFSLPPGHSRFRYVSFQRCTDNCMDIIMQLVLMLLADHALF